MPEATYSQARKAMVALRRKLAGDFADAADKPVSRVSVESNWKLGHHVFVALNRPLTKAEQSCVPNRHMNVPVVREVVRPA